MWMKGMNVSFLTIVLAFSTCLEASGVKRIYSSEPVCAYLDQNASVSTCFVSIKPTQKAKIKNRKESQLMISHMIDKKIPANNFRNQISWAAGVKLKPDHPVLIKIDGQDFKLNVQDDCAWTKDSAEDKILLEALLAAKEVKIIAKTKDGQDIVDTIKKDLKSLSKALEEINKSCSTKPAEKTEGPTKESAPKKKASTLKK